MDEMPTEFCDLPVLAARAVQDYWGFEGKINRSPVEHQVQIAKAVLAAVEPLLTAERDQLRKDRDWWESYAQRVHDPECAMLITERDQLRRQVQAVRAQHVERPSSVSALYPKPLCSCGEDFPCATLRALDGAEGGADRG